MACSFTTSHVCGIPHEPSWTCTCWECCSWISTCCAVCTTINLWKSALVAHVSTDLTSVRSSVEDVSCDAGASFDAATSDGCLLGIVVTLQALVSTSCDTSFAPAVTSLADTVAVHEESVIADTVGSDEVGVDFALGTSIDVLVETVVALTEALSGTKFVCLAQRETWETLLTDTEVLDETRSAVGVSEGICSSDVVQVEVCYVMTVRTSSCICDQTDSVGDVVESDLGWVDVSTCEGRSRKPVCLEGSSVLIVTERVDCVVVSSVNHISFGGEGVL